MAPPIDQYSAGISVDRAEQRPERVVEPNDENAGAERLKILRHKTHPKFFTRPDDKHRDEEDDEIALKREELCQPLDAIQDWLNRRLHSTKSAS